MKEGPVFLQHRRGNARALSRLERRHRLGRREAQREADQAQFASREPDHEEDQKRNS